RDDQFSRHIQSVTIPDVGTVKYTQTAGVYRNLLQLRKAPVRAYAGMTIGRANNRFSGPGQQTPASGGGPNRFDMLSNVMEKARSAAADTPLPAAPDPALGAVERDYPDKLDARLLRISGVCILATVMAILDVTVVSVAQRTFIDQFASTQAVVGWT